MAADRVARSRGAGRRAQRPTARSSSSTTRLPGEEVRRRGSAQEEQLGAGGAGRGAPRERAARRAALPALRPAWACGGCKMQHLHVGAQVAIKQRVLEDNLWHLGKVRPERVLRPIEGPAWDYRQRARAVGAPRRQEGHGAGRLPRAQVELRGRHRRAATSLPQHVSDLLLPLRALIGAMATRDRLPQIELAVGDACTALVLRHLEPLSAGDLAQLRAFARGATASSGGCSQRARRRCGRSTARSNLAYTLPEFGDPDAVPADRLHAGQPADQPRARGARGAPARRRSATSA